MFVPFLLQVTETVEWLASYCFQQRVIDSDTASFGLYPKWKDYVPYLARFLRFLLERQISLKAIAASTLTCEPECAVASLWGQMKECMAPWIQPLDNNGQMLSPWIQTDASLATEMLAVWGSAVQLLHSSFESEK